MKTEITPRGLSREAAASYIGVSPSTFDRLVEDGLMPRGKRLPKIARVIWDRLELDRHFERLDAPTDPIQNAWDSVLSR